MHFTKKNKLIYYLLFDSKRQGFTIIELLIVIMIMAILAALTFPSMINQVGKSRETEAKNILGTISRAQQAYHFEAQVFANNLENLSINTTANINYYSFPTPAIANNYLVKHQAIGRSSNADGVRNYAIGIYHNSGAFITSLCQSIDINTVVDAPNIFNGNCTNGGKRLH